jgi:peptidoglycan hydrolase-like protein with peptidoglycan-binding domain
MIQKNSPAALFFCRLATLSLLLLTILSTTCIIAAHAETVGTLTARVVLRKAATQDSTAVQTLPQGDTVKVLSVSGDWYRVGYGKYGGYIMKAYVDISESSALASSDEIQALGDAPGPMTTGDEGSDVKKLQKALKILGYYTLTVDGKYGDGTLSAVSLYQKAENLKADGIAGKATVTSIFGSCAKTADVTQASDNTESDNSEEDDTNASNTVSCIEDIGTTPKACKEGASGENVVKLQQALELLGYYSADIDGHYGAQTISAVKRFQKNRGMKEDGIAGASTIRVMFSTSKSTSSSSSSSSKTKYTTEEPDWFKDNVSSLIPKKAVFTIKDVRTGKTFQAKRWSGVNHCDTEPLTAADTAIMKSIYGGAWSWNRRPILILYKGHVYAASMNGMPHGTSTIDNNNFNGHFCIHFKNSRTHGTNKVDAAHQKAVAIAAKATW